MEEREHTNRTCRLCGNDRALSTERHFKQHHQKNILISTGIDVTDDASHIPPLICPPCIRKLRTAVLYARKKAGGKKVLWSIPDFSHLEPLSSRCKKWVQNSRRADLSDKSAEYLFKSCVLCAEHFEDAQFMNPKKNKLIWNAIPTKFDVPNPPPQVTSKRPAPKARCEPIRRKVLKQTQSDVTSGTRNGAKDRFQQCRSVMKQEKDILTALHTLQKKGDLCDTTLVSTEGREFVAHAGVLAAASPLLACKLAECDRGYYRIETALTGDELVKFIHHVYAGKRLTTQSVMGLSSTEQLLYNQITEFTSEALHEFGNKGLFCNTALHAAEDVIQPAHSYLLAIEYPFLFSGLKNDTIIHVVSRHTDTVNVVASLYSKGSRCDENMKSDGDTHPVILWHATDDGHIHQSQHQEITMTNKMFICKSCGKDFKLKRYLTKHECIHTDVWPYSCGECGKGFFQTSDLKTHERTHTGEKLFSCTQCGQSFSRRSSLKDHEHIHTGAKPYACGHCGKSFRHSKTMKSHELIHTGGKPYKCGHCGKGFRQSKDVKSHEYIHTGDKPFKCGHCGQGFRQKCSMKNHELIHTGDKPHNCGVCGKGFRHRQSMKTHELIHSGDKPYTCEHCGIGFNQISNMKKHERIHTGEKPYKCGHCGKDFNQRSGLKSHELIHSGKKPHKCGECGKGFSQNSVLKRHQQTHISAKPQNMESVTKTS